MVHHSADSFMVCSKACEYDRTPFLTKPDTMYSIFNICSICTFFGMRQANNVGLNAQTLPILKIQENSYKMLDETFNLNQTSFSIIQHHPTSSNIIQHHSTSFNIIQHHPTSSNIIQHHSTSSNIIQQAWQTALTCWIQHQGKKDV